MAYKLAQFDDMLLPIYNRESGLDTAPAPAGFVATVNGGFDIYRTDEAPAATPYQLVCRAILSEATLVAQKAAIDGLRYKARQRAKLYRQADDDDSYHWAWARLEKIGHNRQYANRGYQILEFTFQVESEWYGLAHEQIETLSSSPHTLTTANAGNRVIRDAILTITASSTMSSINIAVAGATDLNWTGSLTSGHNLVFDIGAKSIKDNDVDAYSGFSYGAGHAIDDWLRIYGATEIVITFTGGGAVNLSYYDGWK